jgi:ligand-binding sensor domain-containing protein
VNTVASWQGLLWVGTEGGLFVLGEGGQWSVVPGATHGLAASADRLAVATSEGLFTVDRDGQLGRLDEGDMAGSWMSVAFHDGAVWAGNMEGVARFGTAAAWLTADQGFTAGWATALLSDGDRLLVGTYSDGLWAVTADGAAPVPGLAGQWVPPNALARVGERVWVGGLGMDPAVLGREGARSVPVPGRDANGFLPAGDGSVWIFTTDGPARARLAPVASRTPRGDTLR